MSIHRFTIDICVDDEELSLHDGKKKAPPNEIESWDARDIFDAADEAIVVPGECEIVYYDGEQEESK